MPRRIFACAMYSSYFESDPVQVSLSDENIIKMGTKNFSKYIYIEKLDTSELC